MKYNQCHSRFNGELLNGKPLNGFLNDFGKNLRSGRGTSENYALDFQQLKIKKPNLSIGLFAEKERKTRLELATPTLARSCSTN